jgi:Flp pilus assembly protein TadD
VAPGRVNLIPRLITGAVAALLLVQCVWFFPGEYHGHHARVSLNADDPAQALAHVTQALAYEQSNPRLYFVLGRAVDALAGKATLEERQARLEAAIAAFDRARRLDPLDGNHPLDLALLYDDLGRFAEAEWMYGLARERDPRSVSLANMYRAHLRRWQQM